MQRGRRGLPRACWGRSVKRAGRMPERTRLFSQLVWEETEMKFMQIGMTAILMGLAASAQAAGYCSAGTATEGIAAGDMTFNSQIADDCYGVSGGNISRSSTGFLDSLNWGTGWTYLDSTDEAAASFMGLEFTVTAVKDTAGTWELTGTDTNGAFPLNFPTALDFAVGLKGSDQFAVWAFDDRVVDGNDSGTFSIVFKNKGGQTPELSHLIVFAREAAVAPVPEPRDWMLMLAGLGLVGLMVQRAKHPTI